MSYSVIVTCEHAGNRVPEEYQSLFLNYTEVLQSHRGWDPGAWSIANSLSSKINSPLFACLTTRLLIEANRSMDSPQLFSEFTHLLSASKKEKLIQEIYQPYRNAVHREIERSINPILHLSIHSFTPIWNGIERKTDIGILFDPSRNSESSFSEQLKEKLQGYLPEVQVHFNEPYQGTDDGFTTWLRKQHTDDRYAGIEIEVNQKFASDPSIIEAALSKSIKSMVTGHSD